MNGVFFLCTDENVYVDAGYRWAYWKLEHTGIIEKNKIIDIKEVLASKEYWSDLEQEGKKNELFQKTLPLVKAFFLKYLRNTIIYVDEEFIYEHEENNKLKEICSISELY